MAREEVTTPKPLSADTGASGNNHAGKFGTGPQSWLGVALFLTFVAYSETLGFEFVYDDRAQIIGNSIVHSWRFVPQYFSEHVWASISPGELGNYYRPIFLLWLRINHALFGLKPWGWHLTSVLAHLAVTLLVYFLASRISGDHLTGAFAALIFGLHPAHIEAVAWASGVTEPLFALPLIGSFLCYLKQRERPNLARTWSAASFILFVMGMLAKETALVLPLLIIAYEWILIPGAQELSLPRTWMRRARSAFLPAIPYLALVIPYLVIRTIVLKGFSHPVTPTPLKSVLLTCPSLLRFYIRDALWPVGLSTVHDFFPVTRPTLGNFLLPGVLVIASAIGLLLWSRRSTTVAFASTWLVLPLIPVLDIRVFGEGDFAHDRYLYLPSVGLSIIVALALGRLKIPRHGARTPPYAPVAPALAVAALLGLGTAYQALYFSNDVVFYRSSLKAAPNNKGIKTNMAALMSDRGSFPEAIKLCQEALVLDPDFWPANYNLGYTYYKLGNFKEADWYLSRAVSINRRNADALLYLGLTRLKMGRRDEAAAALRQAAEVRPDEYGVHFAYGVVLQLQGDLTGALREFNAEMANWPEETAAREQIAKIMNLLHDTASPRPPSVGSLQSSSPLKQ